MCETSRLCRKVSTLLFLLASVVLGIACQKIPEKPKEGLTRELAGRRASNISNVAYNIELNIPDSVKEPIKGSSTIHLSLRDTVEKLILDFNPAEKNLESIALNNKRIPKFIRNGHIIIQDDNNLLPGAHTITLHYTAGNTPLNRNENYLYSLFVPGRASQALPLFDQPDLKAHFNFKLTVPSNWKAVSNSPADTIYMRKEKKLYKFKKTPPLPTYLFSFAAGEFQVEKTNRDGRTLRFFHRETDSAKVQRNRDKIFDLHVKSLKWMKEYTDIDYPFRKFDFVLIPAFQYGGMEHPGAILYRASRLFLDKSATQQEKLGRAGLIAHETAHMWFGDLVTMEWFNDVWTKEVYANFMAAKIVHPYFPDINHEQRFILEHFPPSYRVDRTSGTHPIRQDLDNLKHAGSLYGALIYHKAPIVMNKLEEKVGNDTMREGLRAYLHQFSWGNASWTDLIAILDSVSGKNQNIRKWSQIWVEEAGRPVIEVYRLPDKNGDRISLHQSDPLNKDRIWPQLLSVEASSGKKRQTLELQMNQSQEKFNPGISLSVIDYVLPNAGGTGYGLFKMDSVSLFYMLDHLPSIKSPKKRAIIWIDLWENYLENRINTADLIDLMMDAIPKEENAINANRILSYLEETYWRYTSDSLRQHYARPLEKLLWRQIEQADSASLKSTFFKTYRDIALTDSALKKLYTIWNQQKEMEGLSFSTRDYTRMAAVLSIHEFKNPEQILNKQEKRIDNPDRLKRFKFIRPALSSKPEIREKFFESLKKPENRTHEPWVIDAVGYLHHPLRKSQARKFLYPSLKMLEEIEQTGDIFFPKSWLDASFKGHNTMEAALVIKSYLEVRESYPKFLKQKLLQAADPVLRAVRILEEHEIMIDEPRSR